MRTRTTNPERVAAWVAFLELEADAAAGSGDNVAALACRVRADALRAAAVRTWGTSSASLPIYLRHIG